MHSSTERFGKFEKTRRFSWQEDNQITNKFSAYSSREEKVDSEPVKTVKKVETKDETKGKVGTENAEDKLAEQLNGHVVEKAEFGSGYSIYKDSYDPEKYRRLGRA